MCRSLARQQAADGEGATSLLTCQVTGATDDADARAAARAVVSSSLFKAAVHGRDPNWGRIADALGNAQLADAAVLEMAGLSPEDASRRGGSRLDLDPAMVRISIAGIEVFAGTPLDFDAGCGQPGDGRPRDRDPGRPGSRVGSRRGVRVRPDRGVRS